MGRKAVSWFLRSLFCGLIAFGCSKDNKSEELDKLEDGSADKSAQLKLSEVLHGDWLVYSSIPETPHIAEAYHFWRFDVAGTIFKMFEVCRSVHHSTGAISGESINLETTADHSIAYKDGKLIVQEKHQDGTLGLLYTAIPVEDLTCDKSPSGFARVASQIAKVRGSGAQVKFIATDAPASNVMGDVKADASGDAKPDESGDSLLDHLKLSAGILLHPQGSSSNGPEKKNPDATPDQSSTPSSDGTTNFTTVCTTTSMTQQQMANAFTLFDTSPNIFPGALIQGGPYMRTNDFKQITSSPVGDPLVRKRAPLTIAVLGPTLQAGKKLYTTVQDPSKLELVDQAVRDIIDQGVAQGELNMDVYYTLASSESQLNMDLGVAGGYEGISLSTDFSFNVTNANNHVVLYYFQKFYSVVVNDFGGALNAFDPAATDPSDAVSGIYQIGPNNPPLYIKQVDYGRQIMFEVNSEFSDVDIKSTFDLAFDGMGTGVSAKISSGLKVSTVLENTTIKYKVRGGSDKDAKDWSALPASGNQGSGASLFDQLKQFFSQIKAQSFTTDTPAAPIGYSLNYLVDDSAAAMLYTADFTQKSCTTTAAPVTHSFWYNLGGNKQHKIAGLDDYAEVYVGSKKIHTYKSPHGDQSWSNQSLDSSLSDGAKHDIDFKIYNNGGWATGGTLHLYMDSGSLYNVAIDGGTGSWTGQIYELKLTIDKYGYCRKSYEFKPGENINITYNEKENNCKASNDSD